MGLGHYSLLHKGRQLCLHLLIVKGPKSIHTGMRLMDRL